jgi:hypothetical protein
MNANRFPILRKTTLRIIWGGVLLMAAYAFLTSALSYFRDRPGLPAYLIAGVYYYGFSWIIFLFPFISAFSASVAAWRDAKESHFHTKWRVLSAATTWVLYFAAAAAVVYLGFELFYPK